MASSPESYVAQGDHAEPHVALSNYAATFLSTEHWSLLSARSMAWNETFSRVAVFLNTLSASAVALALVADASGFDNRFKIFALVLFPIVLFLGLATYIRIVQVNRQDSYFIAAMNRLRRAYVDAAPEIRDYLTSGVSDDVAGVMASYLLEAPPNHNSWTHLLAATPTVVGTLNAVIATVGIGGLVLHLGGSGFLVVVVCAATFVACWAALYMVQIRAFQQARQLASRFPSD
jgi:hypothetical protein